MSAAKRAQSRQIKTVRSFPETSARPPDRCWPQNEHLATPEPGPPASESSLGESRHAGGGEPLSGDQNLQPYEHIGRRYGRRTRGPDFRPCRRPGAIMPMCACQGCFGICIGVSLNFDPSSGDIGVSGSLGFGSPGLSGGASASSSGVGTGYNVTTSCGVGPVSGSYDYLSGSSSASVGTQFSSGDCSTTAGASYDFGSLY